MCLIVMEVITQRKAKTTTAQQIQKPAERGGTYVCVDLNVHISLVTLGHWLPSALSGVRHVATLDNTVLYRLNL